MADPGFPGQHTTTTTVQTSSTTVATTMRFDNSYIRTVPGILKIVQMFLNTIGSGCIIRSRGYYSEQSEHTRGNFFICVAFFAFWFTGVLFVFYLFHITEKFNKIPWLKIEFVFCAIWTGFYLIASSLVVAIGAKICIAAGFFGFCAMIAYGIDSFFKVQSINTGRLV